MIIITWRKKSLMILYYTIGVAMAGYFCSIVLSFLPSKAQKYKKNENIKDLLLFILSSTYNGLITEDETIIS